MGERKVVFVTGGSRGIGKAIALKYAQNGYNVVINYVSDKTNVEELKKKFEELKVECLIEKADVSKSEEVEQIVKKTIEKFKKIDVLINNAGITRDGLLMRMKEEDFDSVLDTNLKGAFNMIRHMTGLFIRAREGCIINMASVAGIMGNAGQCNYSASKAGLIGLTKSVAKELAPKGIRCNAVAPGFIATDMTGNQTDNPLLNMIPLGKMGETDDVADAVAYLITAKYVTGEILRVDGGIAM